MYSNKGEIATSITLFVLATTLFSIFIGSNSQLVKNKNSTNTKAQTTCPYTSINEIYLPNDEPDIEKKITWTSEGDGDTLFKNSGVFEKIYPIGGTRPILRTSWKPTNLPSPLFRDRHAKTTLSIPDGYMVTKTSCKSLPFLLCNDIVISNDKKTISNISMGCNKEFFFSWELGPAPSPTQIPPPTKAPTITPSISISLTPSPTPSPTLTLSPTPSPTPTPTPSPYQTNYLIRGSLKISGDPGIKNSYAKVEACKKTSDNKPCNGANFTLVPIKEGTQEYTLANLDDTTYNIKIHESLYDSGGHLKEKFPQNTAIGQGGGCEKYGFYPQNCERKSYLSSSKTPYPGLVSGYIIFPSTTKKGKVIGTFSIYDPLADKGYWARVDVCNFNEQESKPDCTRKTTHYLSTSVRNNGSSPRFDFLIQDIPVGRRTLIIDQNLYKSKNEASKVTLPYGSRVRYSYGYCSGSRALSPKECIIDIWPNQNTQHIEIYFDIAKDNAQIRGDIMLPRDSSIADGQLSVVTCQKNVRPEDCNSSRGESQTFSVQNRKGEYTIVTKEKELTIKMGTFEPYAPGNNNKKLPSISYSGIFTGCNKIIDDKTCQMTNLIKDKEYKMDYQVMPHVATSIEGTVLVTKNTDQIIEHIELEACQSNNPSKCTLISEIPFNTVEMTTGGLTSADYNYSFNAVYDNASKQYTYINTIQRFDIVAKAWIKGSPFQFSSEVKKNVVGPANNVTFVLDTTKAQPSPTPKSINKPKRNILLIIHNPFIEPLGENLLAHYFPTVDSVALANKTIKAINRPNNTQEYQILPLNIVERDTTPPVVSKNNISSTDYQNLLVACADHISEDNPKCIELKKLVYNYNALFAEYKVCQRVNSGEIDEVWQVMLPFSGVGEDDMIGPNPFFINGYVLPNEDCTRNVPVLNFDASRSDPGLLLHSFGHRVEATMSLVYGEDRVWGWKNPPTNNFEKFVLTEGSGYIDSETTTDSKLYTGCGNVHFPPNTKINGDVYNQNFTNSVCPNFLRYPYVGLETHKLNCEIDNDGWGCDDYLGWWFDHLPAAPGVGQDGKLNNWWEYINSPEKAIEDSQYMTTVKFDLNQDGLITMVDIAKLYNVVNKKDVTKIDVNKDGKINAVEISKAIDLMGRTTYLAGEAHVHHGDSSIVKFHGGNPLSDR